METSGYGKTDKWRKTDFRKYFSNFDEIRFPSQMKKRKKRAKKKDEENKAG